MRAAVLSEIGKPLSVMNLEISSPKAGEARVQTKASGICMSDWHIMAGDWPARLPLVPGHEAAGIVEEIGPGPSHVSVGDHVIFSFTSHCGHCRYCNMGRNVLCDGHKAPSYQMPDGTSRLSANGIPVGQMSRLGTFSEQVVCSTENLIPIRKDLPWQIAALIGCSVATGIGAATRHARVFAGATVAVIGCGGVGLNIIQGARLAGASTIIAVDILDSKLAFSQKFGATHFINASSDDSCKEVRRIAGGVDFAFDAIGTERSITQIVEMVRPGGQAIMVGIPAFSTRAQISPSSMVFQEKTLSGSFYGSVRPDLDFPILADLYIDGKIDIDSLISSTFSLDDINLGFEKLKAGVVGRGVVLFD
jgi:S-(hydroxymethyl)glutathione dehydrogenase / alcohol dehydrogenase